MSESPTLRVSIVTVCRNAAGTIEDTIRSVLSQTYPAIDYYIVDGASTDGTIEVLNKYKDRFAGIISEPDSGLYFAMNKALRMSRGDVVLFLNADDVFDQENIVEKIVPIFRDQPDAMLVYGDCWEVDGEMKIHRALPPELTPWTLWLNALCHQALFARTEAYKQVGDFDEKMRVCADWEWTLRAVRVKRLKAVHVAVDVCRFAIGGVCSNREAFERDVKELRCRHYSPTERFLFTVREFFLKVRIRLKMRMYTLPWRLRRMKTS